MWFNTQAQREVDQEEAATDAATERMLYDLARITSDLGLKPQPYHTFRWRALGPVLFGLLGIVDTLARRVKELERQRGR
jgi:hypothetical protein